MTKRQKHKPEEDQTEDPEEDSSGDRQDSDPATLQQDPGRPCSTAKSWGHKAHPLGGCRTNGEKSQHQV